MGLTFMSKDIFLPSAVSAFLLRVRRCSIRVPVTFSFIIIITLMGVSHTV